MTTRELWYVTEPNTDDNAGAPDDKRPVDDLYWSEKFTAYATYDLAIAVANRRNRAEYDEAQARYDAEVEKQHARSGVVTMPVPNLNRFTRYGADHFDLTVVEEPEETCSA